MRFHQKLLLPLTMFLFFLAGVACLWADDESCYMSTPSGYQGMGGASQLGPYPSRSSCESVNSQYFYGHGSCSCTSSASSAGASANLNDAMIQSMAPALQNLFTPIGQALANALFGNPRQQQAQQQQWLQQQALEAARRAEEERRRTAERRRKLEEVHNRMLGELKWLGASGAFSDLSPKTLDDANISAGLTPKSIDDTTLAPKGTSFFGLGGGAPQLKPVNVRRAAYLAQAAVNASPGDAAVLLDEGVHVAEGAAPMMQIPDNKLPAISEEGLRAFQQANIDYRQAHDDSLMAQQLLLEAEQKKASAVSALQRLPEQHEALAQISKQQADLIAEQLRDAVRHSDEQVKRARRQVLYTEGLVVFDDSRRRLAVRALADHDPAFNDVLQHDSDPQSAAFRKRLKDAYDLYWTGSTEDEKLRGKAMLEKVRQDAIADFRARLEQQRINKELEQRGEASLRRDPQMAAALDATAAALKADAAERKAAEAEANDLLRKGLVVPDDGPIADLVLLSMYPHYGMSLPVPKNPDPPLPNPLPNPSDPREKLVQMILQRHAEQRRLLTIYQQRDPLTDRGFLKEVLQATPKF